MAFSACTTCGAEATVTDSRPRDGKVRRVYRCTRGHKFVTEEWPRERVDALMAIDRARNELRSALDKLPVLEPA